MSISRDMSELRDIEQCLQVLRDEFDNVFDPVFGELPTSVVEELNKYLGYYGLKVIKK